MKKCACCGDEIPEERIVHYPYDEKIGCELNVCIDCVEYAYDHVRWPRDEQGNLIFEKEIQ